ncbi:MAG: substrate-binding domain-containing protein, partial [Spirochaetales bacterium]|nr:substrate-binding domain-containing protein [Spirochaetales bacterium]
MRSVKDKKIVQNRIAVLGSDIKEAYQTELWRGIASEAEKYSKQLVCFMVNGMGTSESLNRLSELSYRLADSGNFDGFIIISSVVSSSLQLSELKSIFESRPSIPKISIGVKIDGVGNICVDGKEALYQQVKHLVVEHKRKYFAIIAGPAQHPESEARRHTVVEALSDFGVSVGSELQLYGNFLQSSGRDSVKKLLSSGYPFDAIICLNDRMAIGAIEELSIHGISVPNMVSICGFDGIEEAEYCSPALTTIRQPLFQMGAAAVQELYRLMDGDLARDITFKCVPVFRQSCGCRLNTENLSSSINFLSKQELYKTKQELVNPEKLQLLYNNDNHEDFLKEVESLINSSVFNNRDYVILDEKLNELDFSIETAYGSWHKTLGISRRLLWEYRTKYLIKLRIRKQESGVHLREVGVSLAGTFEFSELFKRIANGLILLGFKHGFIVMYNDWNNEQLSDFNLVFRLKDGKYDANSVRFNNHKILPDISSELQNSDCLSWMFTPLYFQNNPIGHMILPGNHPDIEIYDALPRQVASSMQGAVLLSQVRSHEKSLVEEVEYRTKELTLLNNDLKQEISNRIRLENEVADISKHTMERIGQDLHDDLCQHLAGISMYLSAFFHSFSDLPEESVQAAEFINGLLKESILRAKRITRGLLPLGMEREGFTNTIDGLCRDIIAPAGMSIDFYGDSRLDSLSTERAMELFRIVQEAVNNAVKHSGASL